jgi:hypothetical protein
MSPRNTISDGRTPPGDRERGGEHFTAPLGSLRNGRLRFTGGAHRVSIRVDLDARGLYRARFGDRRPTVAVQGGVVTIRYPKSPADEWLDRRSERPAEISLNARIPWDIEVRRYQPPRRSRRAAACGRRRHQPEVRRQEHRRRRRRAGPAEPGLRRRDRPLRHRHHGRRQQRERRKTAGDERPRLGGVGMNAPSSRRVGSLSSGAGDPAVSAWYAVLHTNPARPTHGSI